MVIETKQPQGSFSSYSDDTKSCCVEWLGMTNHSLGGQADDPAIPIHSHWAYRDQAPFGIHIMVGLFITVVGLVAVLGNILVVITCVRYKDLRTRSNILIINLAVGDLLMCVIDFPLLAVASFLQGWPFGWVVCRMYAFLTATAGLVTINTLGCISADRYWAVVWRRSPREQLPKYVTGLVVLGVWLYAIAWAICPMLGWGDYVLDGIRTTCTFDYLTRSWSNRAFVIAMVFGNFCLPFVVMVFSYAKIWLAVCEAKRGLEEHPGRIVIGMNRYPKAPLQNKLSTSSYDEGGGYLSLSTDFDSGKVSPKFIKKINGKPSSLLWSRSKSPRFNQIRGNDIIQSKINGNGDDTTPTVVNVYKSRTNLSFQRRFPHLCKFKRYAVPEQEFHHSVRHFMAPRNNNLRKDCFQNQQRCRFPDGGNVLNHNVFSVDDGNSGRLYYIVQKAPPLLEKERTPPPTGCCIDNSNNSYLGKNPISGAKDCTSSSSSSTLPPNIISKSSDNMKCRFTRWNNNNKLFLKQHRYRLHCEYKTMKIIMYLLMAFIISWFPYVVVSMIGLFGDVTRITYLTSVFPSLVAKSSMVFNPILYSISHPKVRKRIWGLFFRKRFTHSTSGTRHLHGHRLSSSCSMSR